LGPYDFDLGCPSRTQTSTHLGKSCKVAQLEGLHEQAVVRGLGTLDW
jgi:hypothetical protein